MTRPVTLMADISGHNRAFKADPGAAFEALHAAGIRQCYIKATEGESYDFARFAELAIIGKARGVDPGGYHFARPDSHGDDPEREAQHFADSMRGVPLILAPALDLEKTSEHWRGSAEALVEWALRYCRALAATTYRIPVLYTGKWFWESKLAKTQALNDLRLWLAAYPTVVPTSDRLPPRLGAWAPTAWQYTGGGTVPGIEGVIDLSFVYGDLT